MKNWLCTFLEEKKIDLDSQITVGGKSGLNIMSLRTVYDNILITSTNEQKQIKIMLIKIDFANGDVLHYFKHLAQALAL